MARVSCISGRSHEYLYSSRAHRMFYKLISLFVKLQTTRITIDTWCESYSVPVLFLLLLSFSVLMPWLHFCRHGIISSKTEIPEWKQTTIANIFGWWSFECLSTIERELCSNLTSSRMGSIQTHQIMHSKNIIAFTWILPSIVWYVHYISLRSLKHQTGSHRLFRNTAFFFVIFFLFSVYVNSL